MSDKQFAAQVAYGRKITFEMLYDASLTGYLAGIDAEYFLVLVPVDGGITSHLLRREASHRQVLHSQSTLESEECFPALENIIGPFRKWVRENLLGMESQKPRQSR